MKKDLKLAAVIFGTILSKALKVLGGLCLGAAFLTACSEQAPEILGIIATFGITGFVLIGAGCFLALLEDIEIK